MSAYFIKHADDKTVLPSKELLSAVFLLAI